MMYEYEPKMKHVVDATAAELDAMNSLRLALIQKVLSNTAKHIQLEQVSNCITEAAEKAVTADSIVITVGDIQTHFERFSFMSKWDRDKWFEQMCNLFTVIVKEDCWFEDKLGNGFCWKNPKGEFCKLEIE